MKKTFTILTAALMLLAMFASPMRVMGQTTTLVSGSGTSGYTVPDGWTTSGTVEGGSYLKFDNGTMTSPEFAPHNGLSFAYSVATFGSGTDHPLTIRILNASTNAVISEMTTATPTSSSYINTESPLSLGDVTVAFKIQMYGPTGKGVRLRNYSVTGTPAGGQQLTPSDLALVNAPVELEFDLYDNANAQTISYTTSSTGAVTVSQSNYITATVNANNTITVTPVAVTNGPQTITINQAADGTYAAGSVTFTVEVEDSTPSTGTIATLNIADYAAANNWENSVQYTTATVAPVTFTANGGGNTGKYYTNGQDWRFYQNESASITISVAEGYTLVSVKPTYTVSNTGVLKNGNATIASGTTVSVSGTSVTFTVGNSGSATNGQVRFTNIDVNYVDDGGTQTTSDLAITNQSTDLTFDLYNSATAQVINYTTSSTGAITITPATSEYFSYVHDAQNKTITVTPTAVTPSAQTVTINQAADENYYAGTATFTVSVANSAPLTNIAALTANTLAGNYTVTLNNAVVTYVNSSNAYIQDASGAVQMHKNNHGLNAGDVLNGTATVDFTFYNNNPQITSLSGVAPVSGTAPDPTSVAQSAWNYTFNDVLSQYFQITNATITQSNNKYYVSLGGESIQLYKQGTALSSLDLTKTYTITGFPTLFNSTKELTIYENPEVEVSGDPTITVAPNSLTGFTYMEGNGPSSTKTITVSGANLTAGISLSLGNESAFEMSTTEGSDYTNSLSLTQSGGTVTATTVYVRLKAGNTEGNYNGTITLTSTDATSGSVSLSGSVTAYVAPYAELPFAFDGGRADIANTSGLTQEGLDTDYNSSPKLKFNGTGDWVILQINERPGTLTFDIAGNSYSESTFKVQTSVDGETYTDLETYTTLGSAQSESFNNLGENVRYIKWIYTQKVNGNVALGNIRLAAYETPTGNTITAGNFTNVSINELWDGDTYDDIELNSNVTVGTKVYFSLTIAEGYTIESVSVLNSNSEEVSLTEASESWWFTMPNSSVTINATATATPTPVITGDIYVKVTSTDNLTDGQYLIVYKDGKLAFDGSLTTLDAVGNTISVTMSNDKIQANNATTAAEFTINTTAGTIKSASGYYIGQTSDANGLASSNETAYTNTISFDEESGDANIVSSGGAYLRYNSAINQTRFRYYKSTSYTNQNAIQLYKRVYTLQVDGFGDINSVKTGWNLIASPVATTPTSVTNMLNNTYDLYRYNAAATDAEWQNYKNNNHQAGFTITPGQGYLYANSDNVTLTFNGDLYGISDNEDGQITMANAGWNLVGNPYTVSTTVTNDFYIMNDEGSGITAAGNHTVAPMQGIFVEAENANEKVTFTIPSSKGRDVNSIESVVLNLKRNDKVIDRAIARLNSDRQMTKFQLFEGDTKLYFPMEDADYAIVSSDGHGTMPVNFKAKEMGRYTISVETEGIDMSYLHLIDRLTGEDVNLLLDNEYSFIASNNDSEERFILSFTEKGYDAHGNEIFVYQSGNDLIVNGEGELQIFDVMGRMVKNTTINGVEAIAMPQGVYIFRLNENIQKIVVR